MAGREPSASPLPLPPAYTDTRNAGLETLLMSFQTGSERPDRMQERLDQLEAENRDLRARIMHGRESVERLLARIQFLEDQK